jgi:hypothetical protein
VGNSFAIFAPWKNQLEILGHHPANRSRLFAPVLGEEYETVGYPSLAGMFEAQAIAIEIENVPNRAH